MNNKNVFLILSLALPLGALAASPSKDTDTDFATKAAQAGMAEVATGQLAANQGSDARIKQFGQQMVTDHGKANDELKAIAQKDAVMLPKESSKAQQDAATKLGQAQGKEFDMQYAQMAVKDHEEAVALFKKEADSGKEADMQAFARKTLPTLQQHLKMAQELSAATPRKK